MIFLQRERVEGWRSAETTKQFLGAAILDQQRLPLRGKIKCREDSGNENPVQCNGRHDQQRKMRENATVFGQDSARNWLFYSCCLWKWLFPLSVAFLGKISRRCSCKSLDGMLRTFCAVYDHSRLVALNVSALYIYISKLIYAGKLLQLFRKLFKKQIFSCIPLRRRFFVWQLRFMHLSIGGLPRGCLWSLLSIQRKIPEISVRFDRIIWHHLSRFAHFGR